MSKNRLAAETSPYLLQHADNPVDWHPWNETALNLAKRLNKPILLSIGYSACHWCHVMAHESFEDPATARLMNELFINIKVDREERPDIDKIYQVAHAILTRRNGGWPLTMFLSPDDQVPFFGGTYFPKQARYGLPAFKELLQRVADYYNLHPEEITKQTQTLAYFFRSLEHQENHRAHLDPELLEAARLELENTFDPQYGGFGRAPKFPHPSNIERALRYWLQSKTTQETEDTQALHIAEQTLSKMALGGIYDQLGGGFFRYSVDAEWSIPHFEKMLYDNGALLKIYADAWAATKNPLFYRVVMETADWIQHEMQAAEGGYYATLDADSEGKEGHFYVWDREQIKNLLGDDYPPFAFAYGLNAPANFEGLWHLCMQAKPSELAQRFNLTQAEIEQMLARTRNLLFDARQQRVYPARDEKILTAWNALMIKAMSTASRQLGQSEYLNSAERALAFIRTYLWRDGRLLAVYKDGQARFPAYLDDYAFLLDALLELLQARWHTPDLLLACELADILLQHFLDQEHGGFFFTADDHETLIHRPKPFADEATPAGNGVAAYALNRLGLLLGESRYLQAAENTLKAAHSAMEQAPMGHATLMNVLEEICQPVEIAILRGNIYELGAWQSTLTTGYTPHRMLFAIPNDTQNLPAALAEKIPVGDCVAYLCSGLQCSAPITDKKVFRETWSSTGPIKIQNMPKSMP